MDDPSDIKMMALIGSYWSFRIDISSFEQVNDNSRELFGTRGMLSTGIFSISSIDAPYRSCLLSSLPLPLLPFLS
jgi:hypothetical protein